MSRFVADVWALVRLGLDGKSVQVECSADKSQDLFRKAGINTATTGKMSTKQATKKIGAGYPNMEAKPTCPFIVAYKRDEDVLMLYSIDETRRFEDFEVGTKWFDMEGYSYSSVQVDELRNLMVLESGKATKEELKELETQTQSAPKEKSMGQQTDPSVLIAQALEMMSKGGSIDESQVEAIVERKLKAVQPLKVEVVSATSTKRVEMAHKSFADGVALLGLGKNIALIGEAGSGKSFGAIQMAQSLDLDYVVESCHGKMQSFDLVGAMSPTTGSYISTKLRDAYENGKVLILDEFDRSNTETTIALNGVLAGDCYGFPDGMVTRHKEFRVIACQNTFGTGASKTYASAKAQDGSTLTRFTRLPWDIDTHLERAICGHNDVTRAVQMVRKNAKDNGYDQILITPRQCMDANQMVDTLGWDLKKAINFSCLNGLADDIKKRLLNGVSL
jgi:DNA replication protein DnaC